MKRTALKLALFMLAMPLSALCMRVLHSGWFGLGFVVSLPFTILYWIDLGQALRNSQSPNPWQHAAGVLMGVPQALFGLLCIGAGLAIIGWVLYNTFVTRLPEYSGGFLTLGVGPALVVFGSSLMVYAFRCSTGAVRPNNSSNRTV